MRYVTRFVVILLVLSVLSVVSPALAQDELICEGMEVTHELLWCDDGVANIAFEWTAYEGATSYGLMLIPAETLHPVYYFGTIDPGKLVSMGDLMDSYHQVPTGDYYYTVYANGAEFQECYAGVHTFTLGNLSTCGTPASCTGDTCPTCCEPPEYSSQESFCAGYCDGAWSGCYSDCINWADCDASGSGNGCLSCEFNPG
jgi:hypothetical protein